MIAGNKLKLSDVGKDSPLRLAAAARLAFPDGSMTESGLRREKARGNLQTEVIAGKTYTTLNDIAIMREKCRENQRGHASIFVAGKAGHQSGLSSTAERLKSAQDAASLIAIALKKSSRST
jgi:hypothetical protein